MYTESTIVSVFDASNYPTNIYTNPVGIDFGIRTFLTLSDNKRYTCPHFFTRFSSFPSVLVSKIARLQHNWHVKIANELCDRYDAIFMECLDVEEMKEKYPEKMLDCGYDKFLDILYDIADKRGVMIHRVHKYYASSKTCSCGYINKSEYSRYWTCPNCNRTHDRDLLAAHNILERGKADMEKRGCRFW